MHESQERTLKVLDVWASAYLVACGVTLLRTIPGRLVTFVFADGHGQASRAHEDWRSGDGLVSGKTMMMAYREVRRLAFGGRPE
jgi:hypothetical protein